MARQAEADRIAAVCATPHIRHDHDVRIAELPARLAELAAAVAQAGCGTRILPGAKVAADALDGLADAELTALSLRGAGRWVLLEPAGGALDERLDEAVRVRLAQRLTDLVLERPVVIALPRGCWCSPSVRVLCILTRTTRAPVSSQ